MKIGKQLALPVLILVAGFGFAVSAQESKPATKAPAKKARVFFVEPKNGATVTSPLHMKFGSEGIEIAAGAAGRAHEGASPSGHGALSRRDRSELPARRQDHRQGHAVMGPFRRRQRRLRHAADPGKHKLALQLGDDLHDTLPGTCQEITVTVK